LNLNLILIGYTFQYFLLIHFLMSDIFDNINVDIVLLICNFLDDIDKLNFLSISKDFHMLKTYVSFHNNCSLSKIHKLSYLNSFRNVVVIDSKYLHLISKMNITNLSFGWDFDEDIKGAIPNSVTYLKFGVSFNQNIKGAIPNSVTHLE